LRQRWKVGVATNRFLAEVLASAEPDDGNGKREQCAKEGAERSVRSPLAGHQRPPLTRSRRANASNWIEVPALAARAKDRGSLTIRAVHRSEFITLLGGWECSISAVIRVRAGSKPESCKVRQPRPQYLSR
jgi:hypothetical protein